MVGGMVQVWSCMVSMFCCWALFVDVITIMTKKIQTVSLIISQVWLSFRQHKFSPSTWQKAVDEPTPTPAEDDRSADPGELNCGDFGGQMS